MKNRAVIDFDGERISLMRDGVLLLRVPASVIRKKSETPVGIAYGYAAEERKPDPEDNLLYCKPFKGGKIADESGAKILFRAILREVFGKTPFVSVYVIVSGGLTEEDKEDIARAFAFGGYSNVTFLPRPLVLSKLLQINELYGALYMDSDVTEGVLSRDGEILSSLSSNVSFSALVDLVREKLAEESKLLISRDALLCEMQKRCSLFPDDASLLAVKGKDVITGMPKSIQFAARDLYPLTESVYGKATDMMKAMLSDADKELAIKAIKSGILCLGDGIRINGFPEYWFRQIGAPAQTVDDRTLLLAVAEAIAKESE